VTGKIENVVIGWSPDGKRSVAIDLETLRRHCRPERVEDLLDDLQILCEDVQDARNVARNVTDWRDSSRLRVLR
jgi:hypothetical protein